MFQKTVFILLLAVQTAAAQNFYLKIEGNEPLQTAVIDSIDYEKKHSSVASILETQKNFEENLLQIGYFERTLLQQKKVNDSTFLFTYNIGTATKKIIILTENLSVAEKQLLQISSDTLIILPSETEKLLNAKLQLLEQQGYAMAKLKLTDFIPLKNSLKAQISLTISQKRTVQDLVILGYDKFPKNIKHNLKRKLRNRTFNKELVNEISAQLDELSFISQPRFPEILFTKDSTKIFAYAQRTKPNKFDGFIGFANDEKNTRLIFTGYLDLSLQNIVNSGEKFNLYWRNDGNKQSSFNLGTELPYLFKSPFGIKGNLKIFKQDSTFQNTQTDLDFGYYFNYNTKLYIGYQNSTSAAIQSTAQTLLNDFKSTFYTASFDYQKRSNTDFLFPEKTVFFLKTGIGNRETTTKTNQFFGEINISHHFYLNKNNTIRIKNQSYYLDSDNYVVNELYRFGGINSIRGFRENTLQANFFTGFFAEYRYLLSPSLYVHTITDYGYFQDKTADLDGRLLGLGFGFGMLTQNGLFQLVYANGSTNGQTVKLSNSIVQISFKTSF